MEIGYIIGFVGIALGLGVAPPQLIKIKRTGRTKDISLATYAFLVGALVCYLLHAIYIHSLVFILAQSISLIVNSIILGLLLKNGHHD